MGLVLKTLLLPYRAAMLCSRTFCGLALKVPHSISSISFQSAVIPFYSFLPLSLLPFIWGERLMKRGQVSWLKF